MLISSEITMKAEILGWSSFKRAGRIGLNNKLAVLRSVRMMSRESSSWTLDSAAFIGELASPWMPEKEREKRLAKKIADERGGGVIRRHRSGARSGICQHQHKRLLRRSVLHLKTRTIASSGLDYMKHLLLLPLVYHVSTYNTLNHDSSLSLFSLSFK